MKTANTAARVAQMGNDGENTGMSGANAKTLSGSPKRRIAERYAIFGQIFYILTNC
jgi:hypothetical protein